MVEQAIYWISPKAFDKESIHSNIDSLKSQVQPGNSDLLLAFGGDGTVLKAYHAYPEKRILGIKVNDGKSLGFYSALNACDLDKICVD